MTDPTLQFVHSTDPPATELRVFDSLTRAFLGTSFTFRVIGSSHYVSAPAYDFHELSSCEPLPGDSGATIRLDTREKQWPDGEPPATRLAHETDRLRCVTRVERRPLAAFPAEAAFDLAYWFDDEAVTTVDLMADGFETYHTYPEFDLALYTRTVFEAVPGPAAGNELAASRQEQRSLGHQTD